MRIGPPASNRACTDSWPLVEAADCSLAMMFILRPASLKLYQQVPGPSTLQVNSDGRNSNTTPRTAASPSGPVLDDIVCRSSDQVFERYKRYIQNRRYRVVS